MFPYFAFPAGQKPGDLGFVHGAAPHCRIRRKGVFDQAAKQFMHLSSVKKSRSLRSFGRLRRRACAPHNSFKDVLILEYLLETAKRPLKIFFACGGLVTERLRRAEDSLV